MIDMLRTATLAAVLSATSVPDAVATQQPPTLPDGCSRNKAEALAPILLVSSSKLEAGASSVSFLQECKAPDCKVQVILNPGRKKIASFDMKDKRFLTCTEVTTEVDPEAASGCAPKYMVINKSIVLYNLTNDVEQSTLEIEIIQPTDSPGKKYATILPPTTDQKSQPLQKDTVYQVAFYMSTK